MSDDSSSPSSSSPTTFSAELITPEAYKEWKKSVFGRDFDIWHDGLYVENVTKLSGNDRTTAVAFLFYGLSTKKDCHAATALAALGEVSALPALREVLKEHDNGNRVDVAQAIHTLTSPPYTAAASETPAWDPMARELIAVIAERDLHFGTRVPAAVGLREYQDQESEEALFQAIGRPNEDYLIKYHACASLVARWNIQSRPAPGSASDSYGQDVFGLIRDVRDTDPIQDPEERGKVAERLMRELKEKKFKKDAERREAENKKKMEADKKEGPETDVAKI